MFNFILYKYTLIIQAIPLILIIIDVVIDNVLTKYTLAIFI